MKHDSPRSRLPLVCAFVGNLLVFVGPAASAPPPLPEEMQKEVDRAIDNGVDFLKAAQGPLGSWTLVGRHQAGYAALPGLTLLECGVKPADAAVQKAAAFVRWSAANLDTTYDLSLSILFLDKFGEPGDKALIQMLALRLIAGQTGTGGWSYKCPILTKEDHNDILRLLRKLNPPEFQMPLARQGKDDPRMLRRPGDKDFPAGIPGPGKPDGLLGIPKGKPGSTDDRGLPGGGSSDSLRNMNEGQRRSTGERPMRESGREKAKPVRSRAQDAGSKPGITAPKFTRCIKTAEAPNEQPSPRRQEEAPKPKPRRINIPPHLLRVAVLNDPNFLPLADPHHKLEQPMWGTTDNSNSQFAILALWAARKYDIPMIRTLYLIARRYATSQNFDGGWSYRYHLGGDGKSGHAMTCVGLLGLAVAHELANELGVKAAIVQDPRVINGLLMLQTLIDHPTGGWKNLPMKNLYFLWSVERVGVLYDLPLIGDRDWYRWGAEILLANQQPNGNWDGGGYFAHTPPIDTCLALLFLKRASLTGDLREKLPLQPLELAKAIQKESRASELKAEKIAAASKATLKLSSPPEEVGVKLADATEPYAAQKDNNLLASEAQVRTAAAPEPAPVVAEESSMVWAWLLAGLASVLLFAGALILLLPSGKKEKAKPRSARRRRVRLAEN